MRTNKKDVGIKDEGLKSWKMKKKNKRQWEQGRIKIISTLTIEYKAGKIVG